MSRPREADGRSLKQRLHRVSAADKTVCHEYEKRDFNVLVMHFYAVPPDFCGAVLVALFQWDRGIQVVIPQLFEMWVCGEEVIYALDNEGA